MPFVNKIRKANLHRISLEGLKRLGSKHDGGYPTLRNARQDGLSRSNLIRRVYDKQIRDVFERYDLLRRLEATS